MLSPDCCIYFLRTNMGRIYFLYLPTAPSLSIGLPAFHLNTQRTSRVWSKDAYLWLQSIQMDQIKTTNQDACCLNVRNKSILKCLKIYNQTIIHTLFFSKQAKLNVMKKITLKSKYVSVRLGNTGPQGDGQRDRNRVVREVSAAHCLQ